MPTLAECERPLFTGAIRKSHRVLSRRALRREVNAFESLGLPERDERRLSIKPPKPFHRTSCPGEWRYWCLLAKHDGEETLFVNTRARTVREAIHKTTKDFEGLVVLEVRQQSAYLPDRQAEAWWERDL